MPMRFGLLGDPVDRTRSPEIHEAMLAMAGLDGEYIPVKADVGHVHRAVDELRDGRWDGLNVTMPLKGAASTAADSLSPLASKAGSVNTMWRIGQEVVGDSTDAATVAGLMSDPRFAGLGSVLVIGGGGSAAAAVAGVGAERRVYISSRRPEQARQLSERLGGSVVSWGSAVAGALVINATPVGTTAGEPVLPVLEVAGGLIDLPYADDATGTMREAARLGIPRVGGFEFLVRQAVASFALWTGCILDFEEVTAVLKKP